MVIQDFTFNLNDTIVSWVYNGEQIKLHFDELKDASYYEHENIILVLNGKDKYIRKLIGVNLDGSIAYVLDPPKDYCFYYLTTIGEDDNKEMAVACLDTSNARGFDIFFTIDRRTKELIERGRKH